MRPIPLRGWVTYSKMNYPKTSLAPSTGAIVLAQRNFWSFRPNNNLESNHTENCKSSDKPVAGLLADLKSRGMLKDTLVVWGGEFGRTPHRNRRRPDHQTLDMTPTPKPGEPRPEGSGV
jgi:hypothetical protein